LIVDSTADFDAGSTDPLLNSRVAWFDFAAIVNAFNSAYTANPAVGDWAVPLALLRSAQLGGSGSQAFGGDLAYRYGRDGNLAALDFAAAIAVLGDAGFVVAPQSFSATAAPGGTGLLGDGLAFDLASGAIAMLGDLANVAEPPVPDGDEASITDDLVQAPDDSTSSPSFDSDLWSAAAATDSRRLEVSRQFAEGYDELPPAEDGWMPELAGTAFAGGDFFAMSPL